MSLVGEHTADRIMSTAAPRLFISIDRLFVLLEEHVRLISYEAHISSHLEKQWAETCLTSAVLRLSLHANSFKCQSSIQD